MCRTLLLVLLLLCGSMSSVWGQTTYTYYAIHNKDKGYLKQAKGAVANDKTFRYANVHDDSGSSIWVLSSDGYLQQEMYYLNVANDATLYLSTEKVTQWTIDNTTISGKNLLKPNGSSKYLCADNGPQLKASPSNYYNACGMTITENNSKWTGPSDVSFTVQSPQLVTYLRTYFMRNITVTILKNDEDKTNQKVVDSKDSRSYCKLTYKSTTNANKGSNWDINTTTGVIYNKTTAQQKNIAATYVVAPLDPIVLASHPATDQTITLTINTKAFTPNASKNYLLFNTQENNYRFPHGGSASENDFLPVDGKQSDLTESINEDLSWDIEVDGEGFYSFKNVALGRYIYYDAVDYTKSDFGSVKIGATTLPVNDTRYKFRLFSGGVSRTGFSGSLYYMIPYDKQFAVYNSSGVLSELYFAIYVNTGTTPKIGSLYKASDNAKWQIYSYEWEYRLWDNYSITGDQNIYTAGDHLYTATTWFSRNIKGSRANSDDCTLPGTKTKDGIAYIWEITGDAAPYISSTDELASGTSTLTATITLPPGTRTGTLKLTAKITSPANKSNNKTIPLALYNLNPTLTDIDDLSDITDESGLYRLTKDVTYSSTNKPAVTTFSGTLTAAAKTDGTFPVISGLTQPLFTTATGATISNIMIQGGSSAITSDSGPVGAICGTANGTTRIYNCGVLGGNVSGSEYTGGLVGLLDGSARVINCFSYANITGGSSVGGIVGYNNVATTSTNLQTMVMNCMFYGDITGGSSKAPIYNGKIITNRGDKSGVSNINYFRLEAPYVQPTGVTYNCALGAEDRFLTRFEFYRHLLNSHRELAAWWATGNYDNKDMMAKWVLEPSQIGTDHPYPILKVPGKYPSVVNIDAEHATTQAERNKGGKLGTLTVNIQMGSGAVYGPPTGAAITTSQLTLNITDKDPDHFNFNYYKVQLPYYNDVGTKNYTGNRVVTGWKIVSITGGTAGTYSTGEDVTYEDGVLTATPYNFADRNCTNKDLYSESGRVFNQGAYWDVPYGVTAITIEPYWAKCVYLADAYADVVYNTAMTSATNVPNVGGGQKYTNRNPYSIAGESQKVFTSKGDAIATSNSGLFQGVTGTPSSQTVYDYAVVLVGNYHFYGDLDADMSKPYTVTSIDLDGDNEPDYSYILRFDSRKKVHPVRVDFINIPGLGMAQKSHEGKGTYNFGIMQPKGWFESTNTSLFRETQFEYDCSERVAAPYILQGGVMEQWVNGQSADHANKTTYFHVGGNVWFKEFHRGTHQDNTYDANHSPVSVTGGDFDQFHLTGLYRADVTIRDDNAECYITGGRFGVVAGTGMDGIGHPTNHTNGNITWILDNADIKEFYAGSFNADKPAQGNLHTIVNGGHIDLFCGGPKFGDMNDGRTVTTTATGCTFGTFFGAGYGGNSYSRQAPRNHNNITNFPHNDGQAGNDASWNAWLSRFYTQSYNDTYGGVSTQFNYQFLPMSGNADNCARIFVEYVKFSLATTHSVTSTLTNCTVTGNFYGGGSLGKVEGNVTSILDGCTVNGNVFGAGFSADLPKVMVDYIGFETEPYYYEQLGTYRKGVKYDDNADGEHKPKEYTWDYNETVNSTATAINKTNSILYTSVDIRPESHNLGSVAGNVNLTIKGNSVIGTAGDPTTGNVYGGGDQSYVTGAGNKVTVNLEGNTIVNGNVFGGGNHGAVEGSTTVEIKE